MKQAVLRRHDVAMRAARGLPNPAPVPPRLFDQGFRQAPHSGQSWPGDLLVPKPAEEHIVAALEEAKAEDPAPPELRAVHEIVQTGEIFEHGDHRYVLARISDQTYDALCCAGTATQDLEPGEDLEPDSDAEPDQDGEPDTDAEPEAA